MTGGLKIGVWQPDFDFQLRSRDLTEVDRLFQNFMSAGREKAERLGLAGSGEMQGHLGGTWTDPDATVQISAEDARYANIAFGSIRGAVDMRDGAFVFHPLRASHGDASLELEGTTRYREARGQPRFDLAVSTRAYPLARLLHYLDLDFPVEGKVTGNLHVAGNPPDGITGAGPIELSSAVVWGQKIPLVTGAVRFEPGLFAMDDLRAALGGGTIGGNGALRIKERTFDARLTVDAVPLDAVNLFQPLAPDVKGKLSFQLSGGGSLDHPDLKVTASVSEATFFGHPMPKNLEPRIEATVTRGVRRPAGVPGAGSSRRAATLRRSPAWPRRSTRPTSAGAPAADSPALPAGGGVAVEGNLTLPRKAEEFPPGTRPSRARSSTSPGGLARSRRRGR
jgi:autotransporter translocation and assembly factor TamB